MSMGHFTYGYQRNDRDQIKHKYMDSTQLSKNPANPLDDWWDSPDKVPHITKDNDGNYHINKRHPDVLNGLVKASSGNSDIDDMRKQIEALQRQLASQPSRQKPPSA
jgi:hypothetical protein